MLKHYIFIAILISWSSILQGQEYCNYDTGVHFDMGPGSTTDDATDIITQDDGWMVGFGSSYYISSNTFRASLVRFDVNHNIDPSFGVNGRIGHMWSGRSTGVCIDITSDEKFVIGGYQAPGNGISSFRGYVSRLNSDGSPDETFGNGGNLQLNLSTTESETIGIDAREDGTLRAIMHSDTPRGFYMCQLTSDGELDTTFSDDGYSFSGLSQLSLSLGQGDVIFTPDSGAIVVDYALIPGQGNSPLIFKFDKEGVADTLFNGNGLVLIDGLVSSAGISCTLGEDGSLFVHASNSGSPRRYKMYKFDAVTGEAIESFGDNGLVESTEESEWHEAHGIIIEPSTGNVLGIGRGGTLGSGQPQCTLWTVDPETGEELLNCGNIAMWDVPIQYAQGYRAATVDPTGGIQFWGNGGGADTTSGDNQGGNFLVPANSIPSALNEYDGLQFSIYPNPVRDKMTIKGLPLGLEYHYTVVNQLGSLIQEGECQEIIDLSTLPNGVYSLRIQSTAGLWGVQRIVR